MHLAHLAWCLRHDDNLGVSSNTSTVQPTEMHADIMHRMNMTK